MATLVPSEILESVVKNVKRFPLDRQVPVDALNFASSAFWQYANWQWTVGSLTAVLTTAATKTYTVALPDDFLYAIDAVLSYDKGTTTPLTREAFLVPDSTRTGAPSRFSLSGDPGGSGTLLLSPTPATNIAGAKIHIRYKKMTPRITAANQYTAGILEFPDEYEYVFREVLLHYAFRFSEDSRAGTVQVATNGTAQYSGQHAMGRAAMADLAERIPVLSTDRAPQEKGQ